MHTSLLSTKLYMPPVSPRVMPRPHLNRRLEEGLDEGRLLTLVSAPAGFGKTTLLATWLHRADRPVAWLSLDEGDNDPARLLAYLVAALQETDPAIGQTAQAMLQAPRPPLMEPLLTSLVNDIAASLQGRILVLDDYHVIETAAIHEAITFLLDHLPPPDQGVHLVIATRADPPLPLARLRGRGSLTEVYVSGLRFTPTEAAAFLTEVMGLDLSAEQVRALVQRTEGWATGLRLAALSLRGREEASAFVKAFTGTNRYILEYLTEEVLDQQPELIQVFLMQTAILDRLCGRLCDIVLSGSAEKQMPGRETLEALEAENLFIVPLDDERRWYRYHPLFSDLLRQRLRREMPDRVPELHRRASRWHEENGFIPEAVGHALAADEPERAADLIEWTAWTVLARGEMVTLLSWLAALPSALVRSRPQLGVLRAWALALAARLDEAESVLRQVDVQQAPGDIAAVRAHIAAVRGDVAQSIELGHQALDQLPETKWFSRVFVSLSLGIAYWGNGELAAAGRALQEALALSRAMSESVADSRAAGRAYLTLLSTTTLGHVQEMQGLLNQAAETHRQALDLALEVGARTVPFAGSAYVGLAEVLYEWNDLDRASRHASKGVELSERGGRVSYALAGCIVLARVHQARGELDSALDMLQDADCFAQRHENAYLIAEAAELRARLEMRQGSVDAASRCTRERLSTPSDQPSLTLAREIDRMAAAWVCIGQGQAGQALEALPELLGPAEAAGRMRTVIKVLAYQALAHQVLDRTEQALDVLARALSLAEPEGFVRTFVDEGEPMARLLRGTLARGIRPGYVARLLATFDPPAPARPTALVEPLTGRELEVLRLIAAGLSNQEIADELVVAVSTVKSHINHLYGKLDVRSRTQAVARAQELDLL